MSPSRLASHRRAPGRDGQTRAVPASVAEEIAALPACNRTALQMLWQEAFGRPAPRRIHRELLLHALAYHRQQRAIGGLTLGERRRLAHAAEEIVNGRASTAATIKPGTRLLREWHGVVHEAIVLEKGVDYRGQVWASLSAVAREITGARWSGPRFFGLKDPRS